MRKAASPPSGRERNERVLLCSEQGGRGRPAPPTQRPTGLSLGALSTPSVPPGTATRDGCEPRLKTLPACGSSSSQARVWGILGRVGGGPPVASFPILVSLVTMARAQGSPLRWHSRYSLPGTWRAVHSGTLPPSVTALSLLGAPPHVPGSKAPKGLAVGAAAVPCALGLAGMAA